MVKKILFSLLLVMLIAPSFTRADGGMMPLPNYWVYETGQKAAIFYENKTETLVLQTSFSGSSQNFAYIVPTPNKPEVSKVSEDFFDNLASLTQSATVGVKPYSSQDITSLGAKEEVTVVEAKQVGIYQVKVLTATGANALYDWLTANGFTYPASKKYILDDYITNQWYFTTAKISTEAITPAVDTKLLNGALTPLKLVFATDNIVFPLKISAVTEDVARAAYFPNSVPVTLYIFAKSKKTMAGFEASYANWIKSAEIAKLAKDDNGNPWVNSKSKMYLTKLTSYMQYSQMSSDLFADNASNNNKVGVPTLIEKITSWSGFVFLAIAYFILAAIMLLLFFILSYWQFTERSKKIHRICWILQGISFLIISLPLLAIYFNIIFSLKLDFLGYSTILSQGLLLMMLSAIFIGLPLIMLILMLIENHVQRLRNV